jgi:hypothetical protein
MSKSVSRVLQTANKRDEREREQNTATHSPAGLAVPRADVSHFKEIDDAESLRAHASRAVRHNAAAARLVIRQLNALQRTVSTCRLVEEREARGETKKHTQSASPVLRRKQTYTHIHTHTHTTQRPAHTCSTNHRRFQLERDTRLLRPPPFFDSQPCKVVRHQAV